MNLSGKPKSKLLVAGDTFIPEKSVLKNQDKIDVKKAYHGYDYFISNFEGVISSDIKRISRRSILSMNEESLKYLKIAKHNIFNIANNHISDMGDQGIIDTKNILKGEGFGVFGAGENLDDALNPFRMKCESTKISLLGFSSVEKHVGSIAATSSRPGVAPLDKELINDCLRKENKKSDLILLFLHWGREHIFHPEPAQVDLAMEFMETGADYIIGCHTHTSQCDLSINSKKVWFSLGNFMFPNYKMTDGATYKWSKLHNYSYSLNFKIYNKSIHAEKIFHSINHLNGIPTPIQKKSGSIKWLIKKNDKIQKKIKNFQKYKYNFRFNYFFDKFIYYLYRLKSMSITDVIFTITWRLK